MKGAGLAAMELKGMGWAEGMWQLVSAIGCCGGKKTRPVKVRKERGASLRRLLRGDRLLGTGWAVGGVEVSDKETEAAVGGGRDGGVKGGREEIGEQAEEEVRSEFCDCKDDESDSMHSIGHVSRGAEATGKDS